MNRYNPIGIIDSGIGGLTVAKQIMSLMPNENVIYFGDTAHAPYGNKSNETITEFALKGAQFAAKKNVKLLIVSCADISASALELLRKKIEMPVIGVIEPAAKAAASEKKNKKIGIIGSGAVTGNKLFSAEIKKLNSKIKVFEKAAPLLAEAAEENLPAKVVNLLVNEYLEELKEKNINALVLGSSHYPLIAPAIAKYMGKEIAIINPAISTAYMVNDYLQGRGIRSQSVHIGFAEFYFSDISAGMEKKAERFFGSRIDNLSKAEIL